MLSKADLVNMKLDPESLRARFDRDENLLSPAERRLRDRWRQRAQAGRDFSLTHYKYWLAIDRTLDSDFMQTTQTLVSLLKDLSVSKNMEDAVSAVEAWGMTHLLESEMDPKTGAATGRKTLSVPVLSQVIISIARAYTQNRVARIVNERTSEPLFKYEPAYSTESNKLFCEVITQAVAQISRNFGYSHLLAQAVQACVSYGQAVLFIKEEWNAKTPGKEGLRYDLPHPARVYYDLAHPTSSLNTETGLRYIGYWMVETYGDIRHNPAYWNRERVKMSYRSMDSRISTYLQTTGACTLAYWPTAAPGQFVSQLDREAQQELSFYTSADDDKLVFKSEHFELINPRIDMGDDSLPDRDIWFRVVLGSDDTPLYVAALPARPAVLFQYEPVDTHVLQEGLTLQILPFQNHLTNLMTQGILSAKQSLANLNGVDTDVIDPEQFKKDVVNPNETLYRKLNFFYFSGRELERKGKSPDQLVYPFRFAPQDISAHLAMIQQLLSILERVSGISAQEIGSFASHEQSAEEIRQIHQATSQRYEFVAQNIDRAIEAWKSQLYEYWGCYGSAEALAMIAPELVPQAQQVGFEIIDGGAKGALIRAPKDRLRVEAFTSMRDGPNRVPWQQIGVSMLQTISTIAASGIIPPDQMIRLLNTTFDAMGMPRTFRIQAPPTATPDIQTYITEQLREFAGQAKGYIQDELKNLVTALAANAPAPGAEALPPPAAT